MDRGAWWATVHGVAKSWTQLIDYTRMCMHTHTHTHTHTQIAKNSAKNHLIVSVSGHPSIPDCPLAPGGRMFYLFFNKHRILHKIVHF